MGTEKLENEDLIFEPVEFFPAVTHTVHSHVTRALWWSQTARGLIDQIGWRLAVFWKIFSFYDVRHTVFTGESQRRKLHFS